VQFLAGVHQVDIKWMADGPFVDGAEFCKIKFSETGDIFLVPEDQMKVEGPLVVHIAFDKGSPAVGGQWVMPTLGTIGKRVYENIKRIRAEIFKLDP
jgi:hypothetical protein